MPVVTFYRGDPKHTPRTTMPAHLGANGIITCGGRLLLERRVDSDTWGLVGGGVRRSETPLQGMVREVYEELGLRVPPERFTRLDVYDDPGRVAAFCDGSVWRMVIVVFALDFPEEPVMRISSESKELRFFSREEIAGLQIPVTHSDIVEDWFLGSGRVHP